MHYSSEYCDYVWQNEPELVPVNEEEVQDQELMQYLEMQPVNNLQFQHNAEPPKDPISKDDGRHQKHSLEQIDEYAMNAHAPKTYRQTIWGVNVFRGMYITSGKN